MIESTPPFRLLQMVSDSVPVALMVSALASRDEHEGRGFDPRDLRSVCVSVPL